jgi:hypothetical protein
VHINGCVSDSPSINYPLKVGIKITLSEVFSTIDVIRDLVTSPINEEGAIDTSGIGKLPLIELEEMILNPVTREVAINGLKTKLPKSEFAVLYSLAARSGQEVFLGTEHSLLTRLSNIRRLLPTLKPLIESVGKGRYILHCKYKVKGTKSSK